MSENQKTTVCNGKRLIAETPDEEIVISGIAGRFPDSDNMNHFKQNLFNKVDLISADDRRWKLDHPEIPQRTGKVNGVGKFDAVFFGVHFKQAHTMDPMCRMLLEHTYEAIIDAGVNPRKLRGTRTGVFIGACFSESEKTWFYEKLQVNGFGITGCSRAMLANRISYWLGINGPSYTVDSACSSSLFALEHAYRAIRDDLCDAAIVGGSNLCLHPYVSLQFSRLGVLSADGRCKSFDADANGYTRSEAISIIYIQKAKDAKRIYATLVYAKTNCDGYKEQGITFPSSVMQSVLLEEFYQDCGIPPTILNYVEAHGTGTKVGDPEEVNALDKVFCTGRTTPLKIGSIKSNMGHSEPASGLCSVAKVVIAMETGFIPPNLHYKRPREGVKALEDGRLKVITELTPWECGYVGINSFGFGGANAHVLLRSNEKEKVNNGAPKDDLPRLVIVSGRTEEAVHSLLNDVESRPIDVEYVRLLNDIHSEEIPSHLYRGYILRGRKDVGSSPIKEIQHFSENKRPVWFIFAGMGSQWPGMGEALMRFPIFAEAVRKCDAVLKPRGVDIYNILTNKDKKIFDNILNSFVGIATVQIGLVDLLTSVGITPDYIIGHSVGELGCAYADGCFTAEQMVLSAYSRGLASIETKVIRGSMAAVGLGYDELKDLCPPDIEIACHNSSDSATISGPAESMKNFVAQLQENKIFAKEVPCSNIPYHSKYIAPAGPKLLAYLQKVIPNPKPRSPKWLSTSVPRSEWNSKAAQLSSAEYHTNNLLSSVLFEETCSAITKDAVTIEIAPHGLLQAILRRSLPPSVANIALTKRDHKDNTEMFLQGLGKLYNVGLQPQLHNLYPEVQYPVSRGTPMISPLIKWEHSEDWYVTSYRMQEKIVSGERVVDVTLSDEDFEYMSGHVIDGRNLFPATGYLTLIWETVGMMKGELFTEVSVVFEDVKFLRATTIPKEGNIELTLMVQKGTGRFEVIEGGAAVVTGFIRSTQNPTEERISPTLIPTVDEEEEMQTRDVYKELRLRGYHYTGLFRGIKSASISGTKGHVTWANNWVAFMDNMLQMQILGSDTRGLFVPTGIQKLVIDTKVHLNQIRAMDEEKAFPIFVYKDFSAIVAGGVEIRGLRASAITRRKAGGEPVLEEYRFVAHRDRAEIPFNAAIRLSTHIALECQLGIKVKSVELADEENITADNLVSLAILDTLGDMPLIQADVSIGTSKTFEENEIPTNIIVSDPKKVITSEANALIGVGHQLFTKNKTEEFKKLLLAVKDGGFIITCESNDTQIPDSTENNETDVVLEKKTEKGVIVLLRKRDRLIKYSAVIKVNNNEFSWVEDMKKTLKEEAEKDFGGNARIIIVGEGDFESGLVGLVNCLSKEPGGEIVRGVLIQDPKAPKFSLDNPLYSNQLKMDLTVNVLRSGNCWGSYRHLQLLPSELKPVKHIWINQLVRGDLSSFAWLEGPFKSDFKHPDLVKIHYAPINFRDVMLTTGKLAVEVIAKTRQLQECVIGFEYAGVDPMGRKVMGLWNTRCLSNYCLADRNLCWDIPENWSLEDAATVPCVYGTCVYGLYLGGKMKKGDTVLIHAGTGGVGQAAINLALFEGCEVFTTVGTPEKRKFIRETFPQIPDSHIGNSRDTSFEQMIIQETDGRGVDIVLNSLAEEKLLASVRCLAQNGRFLEIGKFDLAANNPLGMESFLKEISFHGIMLDNLFDAPEEKKVELKNLVGKYLRNGAIKPLTRTVFPKDQAEAAFRYMAAGKHMGKVIINVSDKEERPDGLTLGVPRYHCIEDRSYVILGGLGGFGLELADWLVIRGAQNLVLTSRTGIRNGYQRMRVELWKSYGVKVVIVAGKDASIKEDCLSILKTATELGPVDGIFNLAVVLKDSLWENQTAETFEESFRSKAWSTKQLDELSRKMCPMLRYFVVFSSVSCGRGNAGQTNYGMSNSVMERICERRAAEGLPALAVQWGAVGDVGLVAEMQEDHKELVIGGTLQQTILSCLKELDGFLQQDKPIVASMVVAEKRAGGAGATNIVDAVLNIMGLKDLKTVSQQTSLAELGMDSMMAVEIKQTLEREFEVFLTAQDIRSLNFAKLVQMASQDQATEKKLAKNKSDDSESIAGMRLLMRVLGTGDLDPNDIFELPSKREPGRKEVYLIPGIEGYGAVFKPLVNKIKSPTICLQLLKNMTKDLSILEIAQQLLPIVLERSKDRRDFVIVGYSFGTVVTVELARLLENEGFSGRIVLIDGSPEMMKKVAEQQIPSATRSELETNFLLGIVDMFAPNLSGELLVKMEKCSNWSQKLDAVINTSTENLVNIGKEDQKNICSAVYNRIVALQSYNYATFAPIRSPIILLKPTQPTLRNISEDFGLRMITRDKVEIYTLEGNHVTILENDKVVNAINGEPLEDAQSFKASIMDESATTRTAISSEKHNRS